MWWLRQSKQDRCCSSPSDTSSTLKERTPFYTNFYMRRIILLFLRSWTVGATTSSWVWNGHSEDIQRIGDLGSEKETYGVTWNIVVWMKQPCSHITLLCWGSGSCRLRINEHHEKIPFTLLIETNNNSRMAILSPFLTLNWNNIR
jgi:hypothetical protein